MILEGLVTTLAEDGSPHLAPMGPRVEFVPPLAAAPHAAPTQVVRLVLRPYQTSTTFRNLRRQGEGVFHTTDDVLLLAKAAVGRISPLPAFRPAQAVRGFLLSEAASAWEFRVVSLDEKSERAQIDCLVAAHHVQREFLGFNRAAAAVVEAAILATRLAFLPTAEILKEYERLAVIVGKTAGEREQAAFDFLRQHVRENLNRKGESSASPPT